MFDSFNTLICQSTTGLTLTTLPGSLTINQISASNDKVNQIVDITFTFFPSHSSLADSILEI